MLGDDADAHDHQVGVDERAVGQPDPLDPVAALEPGDADPEAQVDAVVAVQVAHDGAHLVAERPPQRHGQRLEDGDVAARGPAGGRHLGPDEAGAHHHDAPGPAVELGPHGQAVVQRAQRVDPGQALGARQLAGRGAGGDDQAVEADPLAVGEDHLAAGQVEAGGPRAQPPVEVERVDAAVDPDGQRHALDRPVRRRAPAWTAAAGRTARAARRRRR